MILPTTDRESIILMEDMIGYAEQSFQTQTHPVSTSLLPTNAGSSFQINVNVVSAVIVPMDVEF
jgi:hypothetical protein